MHENNITKVSRKPNNFIYSLIFNNKFLSKLKFTSINIFEQMRECFETYQCLQKRLLKVYIYTYFFLKKIFPFASDKYRLYLVIKLNSKQLITKLPRLPYKFFSLPQQNPESIRIRGSSS